MRLKTKLTQLEAKRIISLYKGGMTVKEIKGAVPVVKYLVNKLLKEGGFTKRNGRLSNSVKRMWLNPVYRKKQKESWNNGRKKSWKKKSKLRRKYGLGHSSWKGRLRSINRKKRLVEAYGGKCVCCSETHIEFLTIDHISDKVRKFHRKSCRAKGGGHLYKWLEENKYPKKGVRLLCMNCNLATSYGRICPHKKKTR